MEDFIFDVHTDQLCHRYKRGHFKKMCRSELSVRDLDTTNELNQFLEGIHPNAVTTSPRITPIYVNKRVVNFKIDTGADVTVISS